MAMKTPEIILKEIESEFPVDQISVRNIKIWALLRIYLYDCILAERTKKNRRGTVSMGTLKILVLSLLRFNPFHVFRSYKYWIFASTADRKIINNTAYLGFVGAIPQLESSSIIFESPFPDFKVHSHCKRPEKHVCSSSIFYILGYFFELWFRVFRPSIQGEELIRNICVTHPSFAYRSIINRFLGQYRAGLIMLSLFPKPKVCFMICPSVSMGIVAALKKRNIRVVEVQHGVVNEHHITYNSRRRDYFLLPDEFLVFGEQEKSCLTKHRIFLPENKIHVVGSFLLELIAKNPITDHLHSYREHYKTLIVISAQEDMEDNLINFVNQAALLNPSFLWVYVPRNMKDYGTRFRAENIIISCQNIYELIKECDIHATVYSTTCLEAQYFEKTTIFININGASRHYYSEVLNETNGAFYAENPEEFIKHVDYCRLVNTNYSPHLIAKGHFDNMSNYLKSIENA